MFEFNDNEMSHMPFVCIAQDGSIKQFCCRQVNGLWKLHHLNGDTWERLNTGLPEDATECGPTAEYEDGMWKISFIAGGAESDRSFKLYRLLGIDGAEPMMQAPADVGFVWKYRTCFGGRRSDLFIQDPERKYSLQFHRVEYLYRVSYNPFNPNQLLISGKFFGDELFSWAYHLLTRKMHNVIADGVPAYKAAFFRNDCYYARRDGNGSFEDRHIVKAENLVMEEINADDFISQSAEAVKYVNNNTGEFQ